MQTQPSNFDTALKAEAKRVVRCFQSYDTDQRANKMASNRQGHRQRHETGRFYYLHPDVPGICFPKRFDAALHALGLAA